MIDFDAIERANAPLNAFLDFDRTAAFGDGPLAGTTIGVKANIAVAGLPWTAGMALYRDRVAERDADVVARLRRAGAAIIGTTNMEEAALGAKTDNPWFGATQNPHRIGHTAGGSSGGSGAAVAAGLCDAALGTDTMGSVRIPAAYCGVYGFKPANDAVSQDGLESLETSLDCIGPLARSIDRLEAVARAIGDFGEGTIEEAPATLADLGGVICEAPVLAMLSVAKMALNCADEFALRDSASRIRFAGFVKVARALRDGLRKADEDKLSDALRLMLGYGDRRSKADWKADRAILRATADKLREIAAYRPILLPTTPQTAFAHDSEAPANQADFTCLANIAGLPAITIPVGADDGGLPIGIQLVGAPGREAGLFALARRLDARLDGYFPPPNFLAPD